MGVSRTYAEKATLKLRAMEVRVFPSREIFQMIEERIPGGRFLTTAALLLGLLAVIAASCSSLWQHIGLPMYSFIADAVRTRKIDPHELRSFLVGAALLFVVSMTVEFMLKTSSRLMRRMLDETREILKHNTEIIALATEANENAMAATQHMQGLDARIKALEEGEK
jgi:hypothetical protein